MGFMSDSSSNNYLGSLFPITGKIGPVLLVVLLASTGCLGQGDGNPKCDPIPYSKTIKPVKIHEHDLYFNIDDFDFFLTPNLVISDISFQGEANGRHRDDDRNDDFDFETNITD